ncbi:MAG: Polyketide cyclase / dehydrase and lipid transport [Solirubrobacterales bacterium]|jgi:carbon monoxide dehydrogenase subunit G|nr:Polyketide cyclase / dehydrase and lipid transport [Solirubrobacterales bacterium]
MRVAGQIDISATPEQVWEFITDPERVLHFMSGITRWECAGDEPRGLGARYRMLMRVGSAEVGGTVEVTEYDEPRDMAWNSVTGIDQRGRWRVRKREFGSHPPRTHVEFRLSYGVAGAGVLGWLSERFSAPTVERNIRRSLQQLKRAVEHEQLRQAAAERRSARASA